MSCLSSVSVNVTCRTATTVAATCSTSAEVVATCRANGLYENTEQEGTYEATCPAGYTGTPVSSTVNVPAGTFFSTVSTLDADNQATSFALAQATSLAEASIVCVLSFGNVALSETVTIRCPTGSEGDSVTETASVDANIYTSNVSQAEADASAREAAVNSATQLALPQLACLVTYSNDAITLSYTASCPYGSTGPDFVGYGYVPAETYFSTLSKATANASARAVASADAITNAEDGLSCELPAWRKVIQISSPPPAYWAGTPSPSGSYTIQNIDGFSVAYNAAVAFVSTSGSFDTTEPTYSKVEFDFDYVTDVPLYLLTGGDVVLRTISVGSGHINFTEPGFVSVARFRTVSSITAGNYSISNFLYRYRE